MSKWYISKSKINKKGVFLTKDVKKDELIFKFSGKAYKNKPIPWHYGRTWLQVGYCEWIIPHRNNPGNFLNHSCSPSAGIRGRNSIVAIRDLKAGEEVTMDYALSDTLPLWHMKCSCGSKNCRKYVKPYQDLTYQQQRKFVDYTAKYIKDMKMHLSWAEYLKTKYKKK